MKRLVWLVVALLGFTTGAFAQYDGPTPVTYDQTLSSIRVVFKSQGKVLQAGRSRFTNGVGPAVQAPRGWHAALSARRRETERHS